MRNECALSAGFECFWVPHSRCSRFWIARAVGDRQFGVRIGVADFTVTIIRPVARVSSRLGCFRIGAPPCGDVGRPMPVPQPRIILSSLFMISNSNSSDRCRSMWRRVYVISAASHAPAASNSPFARGRTSLSSISYCAASLCFSSSARSGR